ncbi:acyltransferase family protein [Ramlibacter rhizophilus]|uniref:Acyltransferase n=1 Tax=Ramlibacter rhizophilus TaxID=1781167 RepID=A0A4Z0C2V0_9BURK|nr:acyltransferase [Ramlibacter rhizophilus]TFZ04800.1 acyltransferase [Ramlibacter rhizophilus]
MRPPPLAGIPSGVLLLLQSVQAGRALAATSVAAFHLSLMMGDPRYGGSTVFERYTREGNLGVDFFFVLSGFIIMFAHARDIGRPQAVGHYLRRRWARLFPIYWLYTLGITALVLLGLGSATPIPDTAADWLSAITLIRFTPVEAPIRVAWTLFHEVAFYLAFALLILNKRLGIAFFTAWGLVCLWVFKFAGEGINTPGFVYTSLPNFYFLLGMGAYLLMRRGGSGWWELGVGAAIVAVVAGYWPPVGERWAEFPVVIGFAFLLAGITKFERNAPIELPRSVLAVGDASYSLYLLHLPLSGLLLKLVDASGVQDAIGERATYLLVLGGAIGVSVLAYRLVEAPLLRRLRVQPAVAHPRERRSAPGPEEAAP